MRAWPWNWPVRAAPPACLSGGETTVTLEDSAGRGGRNTEYALALALALDAGIPVSGRWRQIPTVSMAAGATAAPWSARTHCNALRRRAWKLESYLRRHDSAGFFEQIGGLLDEGPTGTNVNDFRAILVNP